MVISYYPLVVPFVLCRYIEYQSKGEDGEKNVQTRSFHDYTFDKTQEKARDVIAPCLKLEQEILSGLDNEFIREYRPAVSQDSY